MRNRGRAGDPPRDSIPQAMGSWAPTKASHRFFANEKVKAEPSGPRLIHVFSREGDTTDLFTQITAAGEGVVIRALHDRRVLGEDGTVIHVNELIGSAFVLSHTRIQIRRRNGQPERVALWRGLRDLALLAGPFETLQPRPP